MSEKSFDNVIPFPEGGRRRQERGPEDEHPVDFAYVMIGTWTHPKFLGRSALLCERIIFDTTDSQRSNNTSVSENRLYSLLNDLRIMPHINDPYADYFLMARERAENSMEATAIYGLEQTHTLALGNETRRGRTHRAVPTLLNRITGDEYLKY